ncbi:WhiB family transcriptional regulator [Streptomyces sp. NPDC059786]|uniref:WhiB family transcriptional regulator n=1 Tax=Streptomyces sp. NPDC059786 TaxID=3346946 RepID=UPI0036697A14
MVVDSEIHTLYWREIAACLHADPDLFFPIGSTGPTVEQIDEAKAVCGRCPVLDQCLGTALRLGHVEGIWGGTTETERRAMRRLEVRRRLAAVTVPPAPLRLAE